MSKRVVTIAWRACLGLVLLGAAARAAPPRVIRIIAQPGQPAPGNTGRFKSFGQLDGADPAISGENVAFLAITEQGGGIYAYTNGQFRVIADTKTKFPGTDVHFGFDAFSGTSPSISGGNVAFGTFRGPFGPQVICAYINGEFRIIATAGETPAPGSNSTFRSFFIRDGSSPSISGENVAFLASRESDRRTGIYAFINGQMQLIANTDTLVPGVNPPTTFSSFGALSGASPSISGENVAFLGVSAVIGTYARINGQLIRIADGNTTPSLFGLNGGGPSISGESVIFRVFGSISAYINGSVRVLGDTNTPAPGSTGNFTAGALTSPVIDGENIAFCGGAPGIGHAIFAFIDGSFELIASINTPTPHQPGRNFDLFFSTDDDGDEGVRPAISGKNVVFTAAPNGLYLSTPLPLTHGDFDGNRCVDLGDVAAFQRCFGETSGEGDDPNLCVTVFDFDANNAVDLADFVAFQTIVNGP